VALISLIAFGTAGRSETTVQLPPYNAGYEPRTVDERGLWMEADEHERRLRDSPLRIKEGGLEEYVRNVLCREVGPQRCTGVRVYVMEIPSFNATMMANGTMEIWSGLFLRVRSEAELAAVLGHEFAHFELRHVLNGFKSRRSTTDVLAWVSVLGGMTNTNTANTQWLLAGSIYRFDRSQETEADLLGLKYLAGSGYPAASASELWRSIMAEDDARALGRKQKPKQPYSAGFFDTHPTHLARATYLAKEAAAYPTGGDDGVASYQKAIAPYLPGFLDAQIKLNDFGGTDYIIGNLAARSGWTPVLLFARAELYRARGNPRDLQAASQLYRDAAAAGYSGPELQRNLGLSLLRNGQGEEGKGALREYLRMQPEASDAKAINALLAN
jgi:Zn-dependent protease with chaperone function